MQDKPLIFISHIAEEASLANVFKIRIEQSFLGMVDVFVSSDPSSVGPGKNWRDEITRGLRTSKAMLVLCSPNSVSRPWINFESGAGWVGGIEVVPVCHSGLHPHELPLPLKLLQGIEANNPQKIMDLFALIAAKLSSAIPAVDSNAFVAEVIELEKGYATKVERRRADPDALQIVIDCGPNYETAKTYPKFVTRTLSAGVKNYDNTHFISNCQLHVEIPETSGKTWNLLERGFTLNPGEEKFAVAYHHEYFKAEEHAVDRIIFSVPVPFGLGVAQPRLPPNAAHFVTLKATSTDTRDCEVLCKLWVDESDKLRLERA